MSQLNKRMREPEQGILDHYERCSKIVRFLRKVGFGRWIRAVRQVMILETVHRIHLSSVHSIRRFAVDGYYSGALKDESPFEPFFQLVTELRNTMAKALAVDETNLHCTLKVCEGEEVAPKEDWNVYTIGRSLPCRRPMEFRPVSHKIGHNSSFASLAGCSDRQNHWEPYAFSCFCCNDLSKHPRYDCSRPDWDKHFRSTLVFPLRYKRGWDREFSILGFLTFDSLKTNIFSKIPDTFDYMESPDDYDRTLRQSFIYHTGGIMADTLATTFALQKPKNERNGKDAKNGREAENG